MTVQAELQFITNTASEAAAAAQSVIRLQSALSSLASLSGTRIDIGVDLVTQFDEAAQHAATIAEIQTKSAAKLVEIEAASAARMAAIAAQGEANLAAINARSAAQIAEVEARSAAAATSAASSIAAVEAKAAASIAMTQAKSTAEVEVIAAKAQADAASHQQRIAEQFQRDNNAIMVAGAKASHDQMSAEQAHRHAMALLEVKGAQEAAKIRLKGEQDQAKLAAKAQIDAAKQASRGASRVAAGPSKIGGAAQSLLQGGGLQGAASQLGGAAGAMAGAAATIAGAVGAAVVGGAKMAIDSAEFKRNMITGLDKMLGGADAANAAYRQIQTIANVTPFETEDVGIFYRTLAGGLGDVKKTEQALLAVSDVAALNDFDTEKAKRLSDALAKMAGSGKLSIETLNQLGDASGGVIGRGDVFDAVAKITGKSRDVVQKEIEKGKIDATKGLDAILSVVRSKVSGGELGSLAKTLGESSVTGLLSTIRGVGSSLFEDVDIEPIVKGLKSVSDAVQGPAGEKLKGSITTFFSTLFEAVFGPLGDAQGPERVSKMLDQVSNTINKASAAVKEATPTIQMLGKALLALGAGDTKGLDENTKKLVGFANLLKELALLMAPREFGGKFGPGGLIQPIFDMLGIDADATEARKWVDAIADLFNPRSIIRRIRASLTGGDVAEGNPIFEYIQSLSTSAGDAIRDGAVDIGSNIVDGIVLGIEGGLESVKTAATNMATSALDAAKSALGIHSPSWEFETGVGLMGALGAAQGFERGTPHVVDAAAAMADASLSAAMRDPFPMTARPANSNAMAGGGMMAGGAAQVVNINLTINVNAEGAGAEEIGDALEARLRPFVRNEFVAALRSVSGA